jgi:hypothetical protein
MIYLSSTKGLGYEFRREQTIGAELGGILFRIQAIASDRLGRQDKPRNEVQRTVFTLPAHSSLGTDRIEVGDRVTSDVPLQHQFTLMNVPTDVQDLLREVVAVCRRQNYSISEFTRTIVSWLESIPEGQT